VDNETENRIIERLDKLVERSDKLVDGMERLVDAIPKPASRARQVVDMLALTAGVLSILGIIEVIRQWIIGG
jgi:hypothetical protein